MNTFDSGWCRTQIRRFIAGHSEKIPTASGTGWTTKLVPWPVDQHLRATAWEEDGGGWRWRIFVGSRNVDVGSNTTEAGARSAMMRRIRKHAAKVKAQLAAG